jgi:xanthosine utilization system XapX-like protein
MAVQTGVPPLVATTGLVGWLVQQLAQLARQALITGIKKVILCCGGVCRRAAVVPLYCSFACRHIAALAVA